MAVKCNLCDDRGLVLHNNLAEPCLCVKQRAINNKIKASQIPPQLSRYTFNDFKLHYYSDQKSVATVLQAAKEFVPHFLSNPQTKGLLFTGPVGSGKTFLSCCIANSILAQNKSLLFAVVPELLEQIKATYGPNRLNTVTESELLDVAREVPLLLLDDLGAHNYTDWTKNKIFSIVNYRLNYLLPTIITSNISLEDLGDYLGERTTSRISQMCIPYRLPADLDIRMQMARH